MPETPPPVLREAELRKLLDACAGTDFEDRRDNAMIRLFLDSGMRRGQAQHASAEASSRGAPDRKGRRVSGRGDRGPHDFSHMRYGVGLGVSEATMRRWRLRGLVASTFVRNGIHRLSPEDRENRYRPPVTNFPQPIEAELPTVATTDVDGG